MSHTTTLVVLLTGFAGIEPPEHVRQAHARVLLLEEQLREAEQVVVDWAHEQTERLNGE